MKKLLLIMILVANSVGGFSQTKCGDTLIDARDGKKYGTIKIGSQCWMKDNLDVGTFIVSSTDQTNNNIIEKYGYIDNAANCNIYGGLYKWSEMMGYSNAPGIQGICPAGWHLPTNAEWNTLQTAVGVNSVSKLIVGGSSGFEAEYSGVFNGTSLIFEGESTFSLFWTSSLDVNNGYPFRKGIYNTFTEVWTGSGNVPTSPNYGYCVRCISNTLMIPDVHEGSASPVSGVSYMGPNPVKDILSIQIDDSKPNGIYEIIDMYGNSVKSGMLTNGSNTVDVSGVRDGIYIVKITFSQSNIEYKKIKIIQ